ncbi:uncharacterized protein LOC143286360 [Babylonia areolata]|uniref:uncharacterized protein LOC143286360 n=1 Tax=Babylonia areolata TaxID=304850 RepID=UPI003FD3BCF4
MFHVLCVFVIFLGPLAFAGSDDCSFEADTPCTWRNVEGGGDQLDWSLHHGPLVNGPSADHTTHTAAGHYIYMNSGSSKTSTVTESAMLVSSLIPGFPVTNSHCLQFWFTMHVPSSPPQGLSSPPQGLSSPPQGPSSPLQGPSPPSLTVSMVDNHLQKGMAKWSVSGDHGEGWHQAALPVTYTKPYLLVIQAQVSRADGSTIAVDDITYTDQNCQYVPSDARVKHASLTVFHLHQTASITTSPPATTSLPLATTAPRKPLVDPQLFYTCDMEASCVNTGNGAFQWLRHNGSTDTHGTGPSGDHTLSTQGKGYYIYLQAKGRAGRTASFRTVELPASHTDVCLQFYYHMYGAYMGILRIKLMSPVNPPTLHSNVLWSESGNQDNQWLLAQVNIKSSLLSQPFEVVFEGTVSNNNYFYQLGDMAVDDIHTAPVSCPLNGDCSFEMRCTWNNFPYGNSPQSLAGLSDTGTWDVAHYGRTPAGAPRDDHTFNNTKGYPVPGRGEGYPGSGAHGSGGGCYDTPSTHNHTHQYNHTHHLQPHLHHNNTHHHNNTTTTTTPISTTTPSTTTHTYHHNHTHHYNHTHHHNTHTHHHTHTHHYDHTHHYNHTHHHYNTHTHHYTNHSKRTTRAATSTTTEKPNQCHVCRNLHCFTDPVTVACPPDQPVCASRVTDTDHMERAVVKGCISRSECKAWTPGDLELENCLHVDQLVTGRDVDCLFCCHGDLCNKGPNNIPKQEDWIEQKLQTALIG